MDKNAVAYLAASFLTTQRIDEVAASYLEWLDDQDTLETGVTALMKSARSSKNSAKVLANADVAYAAIETDAPTITSIAPATGAAAGGTAITVTGRDLTGATALTIGGTACTSRVVVSDTSITAVTPAKTAGAYDVVVTTPAGSDTLTAGYTYT